MVDALRQRPDAWVDFMMRFELGPGEAGAAPGAGSAATIAGAYIVGGFIPLGPYILIPNAGTALIVSVIVTLMALTVFGYIKGRFTGTHPCRSAIQTALIGGMAAAAAFAIARAIS